MKERGLNKKYGWQACSYCGGKPDGAMLVMGINIAHADCVIRKLNELIDPDYDGTGEPSKIVGFLAGYVELAEDQTTPLVPDDYEDFAYVYLSSQADMFKAGWRKIKLEKESKNG